MRLFIAVNLNADAKEALAGVTRRLQASASAGSFTRSENLHLTLIFLGEVPSEKAAPAARAMDLSAVPGFGMRLFGASAFQRSGGDIWWVGVKDCPPLGALHLRLAKSLSDAGFVLEKRRFSPHLTIGRGVVLKDGFDKDAFSDGIPGIFVEISEICLMKSERVRGALTYTPIHRTPLAP